MSSAALSTWERPERDSRRGDARRREPAPTWLDAARDPAALAGWTAVGIEVPALEISSTDLRERAATGRPLDYLVPDAAVRVIAERGLYAPER